MLKLHTTEKLQEATFLFYIKSSSSIFLQVAVQMFLIFCSIKASSPIPLPSKLFKPTFQEVHRGELTALKPDTLAVTVH